MKEPNIKDELKSIAPELNAIDRSSGFAVPPEYFKQLQDNVLQQVTSETTLHVASRQSPSIVVRLFNSRVAMVAASFVALCIMAVFLIPTEDNEALLSNISSDDAYEYIYDNIGDFETEDLLSYAGTENLDALFDNWSEDDMDEAIDQLFEENGSQLFEDIDLQEFDELF